MDERQDKEVHFNADRSKAAQIAADSKADSSRYAL
jgi:hypothetical protein